ncbi:hypothetical protein N8457_00130 [bacterium]|nr:hypothetical protein [bacterium]
MSTPLYDALVAKVRDWSNRDSESLPDSIIKDSLEYAAESAYRELRLQGMEKIYTFEADNDGNTFNVPSDLKEFISLRQLSSATSNVAGTETYSYTATTGQTLFSGDDDNGEKLQYVPGAILVTVNGVFLSPSDYTATNGLSIVLGSAAFAQDEIEVVAFNSIVDSSSITTFEYTATAGQTTFTGADTNNNTLSYKLNRVLVTINGVYQSPSSFTATNRTSIVLNSGASLNDQVKIVSFNETTVYSSEVSTVERETTVYENRADYRTFVSDCSNKYSLYLWTRQGDKIVVNPKFKKGDAFELFYYSNGTDLGTEYAVTSANFQNGLLETSDSSNGTALYFTSASTPVVGEDVPSNNQGGSYTNAFYFKGKEQPHFLRDNQERLLIYGALSFINDYLGETNESTKYETKAAQLIQRLLNEEVFKESSGGNVRINFEGPLI